MTGSADSLVDRVEKDQVVNVGTVEVDKIDWRAASSGSQV